MKKRKLPLRMCTGCQEMKDKREMIRVVKDSDANVSLDFTGKKPGRGAYICPDIDCLNKAEKTKGLERSLKKNISSDIYDTLRKELSQNE